MTLLPDINPERYDDHEPVSESEIPHLSAEQKATMMEQGFASFVLGNRQRFTCYFMLEDAHHSEIHALFVKKLSLEDPLVDQQSVTDALTVVLANSDIVLIRQFNTYEDGTAYGVTYVGMRSEDTNPYPSAEA